MRIIGFIFILFIVLLGIGFATLNSDIVTVHYYLGERTMPLSLLLVSIFVAGCLLGLGVGLILLVKIKIKNYRLRQRLKTAEREIESLRALSHSKE